MNHKKTERVTIYLREATARAVKIHAEEKEISRSSWVSMIIANAIKKHS